MADPVPTILIVDDDPDVLSSLATLVRTLGYQVLEASGGQDAIRHLEATKVDLVVTDYRMPGMDGLELLVHVRDQFPHARRMLMTAYADPDVAMAAANNAKVVRFVTKPIDAVAILDAIKVLLKAAP